VPPTDVDPDELQHHPQSAYAPALKQAMRRFLQRMSPGTRPEMQQFFRQVKTRYVNDAEKNRW